MPDDDRPDRAPAGPGEYGEHRLVRPYIRRFEQTRAENASATAFAAASDGPSVPVEEPVRSEPVLRPALEGAAVVDLVPSVVIVARGRRRVLIAASCGALALALAAMVVAVSAAGRFEDRDVDAAPDGSPGVGQLQTTRLPTASAEPGSPAAATSAMPKLVLFASPYPSPYGSPSSSPFRSPETRSPEPRPSDSVTSSTSPSPVEPSLVPARTGRITSLAGLCLDGGAGNSGHDDRVRLRDCDGTEGQVWIVADDGTMRVQGRCMQATTGLVRLRDCTGGPDQQWRPGVAGSLINPASGLCLGKLQGDSGRGSPQRVASCTQSDAQRWTLP
ncbi:RICIN domain-containing protein [Dactylosporangium sp. AC04546]|uniref:RICIN domain-containing protein n=1 Tax=Dactylosporangium sp. AC04546 TaxID=2862460 RepID=UPI001EDDB196|nr:RICIN domain-containing protein [Dactylosporangium sp. AC04546]WVK82485.1 RICIN domain-containing protein [Dactylosporangium sp. AC04546]